MIVLTEYHKNSTDHFELWGDNNKDIDLGISSISIEAEQVFSGDKDGLISQQVSFLKEVLQSDAWFKEYKLYFLIHYGVSNPVSSIARYKKVWKRFGKRSDFDSLIKGKEIELQVPEGSVFCSIAQFSLGEMDVIIRMMYEMSYTCTVVASTSDLMTEKETTDLFNIALLSEENKNWAPEVYRINFGQLCTYLCSKNDMVVRLGDASEEVSLAVFFQQELFQHFQGKVSFDKMFD